LHSGLKSFHCSPSLGGRRKNHADPAHHEENCRSYAANSFEAVTARQAASFCKDDIDRKRILELLDSEIEAFNNVMAASCNGSLRRDG
jgi:hypothetical protein